MIDKNKIPEHSRKELEELLGVEGADKYLDRFPYNLHKVQFRILREKLEQYFGKGNRALVIIVLVVIFVIHQYWRVF